MQYESTRLVYEMFAVRVDREALEAHLKLHID
jgi:hypothetical protein